MLYWRFAAVYFFYFAIGGALLPYGSLYFQRQGFSPTTISKLMGIFMATRIIAPSAWGWLVYKYAHPVRWTQLAVFLTWFSLTWIFWWQDVWIIALIIGLFSFFWNASLPQIEIITFNQLQHHAHRYSTIRLWGSVGFILTVISLGQILNFLDVWIIPFTMLIMSISLWLSSLSIPELINKNKLDTSYNIDVKSSFKEKFGLFSACFIMNLSHAVYYVFYTSYLMQHGYSSTAISNLWALAVTAEIGLLLIMPKILPIHGPRRILIISFLIASLRWWLIGNFPNVLAILILAQCLHAATFAAFHSSAIYLVYKLFSKQQQNLGQSLYSSLSFGAGGASGSFISGYLWTELGSTVTFEIAAVTAFLGAMVTWIWVSKNNLVIS